MKYSRPPRRNAGPLAAALALLLVGAARSTVAEDANEAATTNRAPGSVPSAPQRLDEAAFRVISERNIFNANRSGGTVRAGSTRRPAQVQSFKLVGTMAYEKGAFAFFEGSNSELTKVLKADGVIAGYKLVDILADAVKLEGDGQILDLPIGSAMRREDDSPWRLGEAVASSSSVIASRTSSSRFNRNDRNDNSSRSRGGDDSDRRRGGETESRPATAAAISISSEEQNEILKRMMERRAKDSQ